jgi:hypothetical protein
VLIAAILVSIIVVLFYFGTVHYIYNQEKIKNNYKKSFIYFYLFDSTAGFQILFLNWLMLALSILCIIKIIIKFIQ